MPKVLRKPTVGPVKLVPTTGVDIDGAWDEAILDLEAQPRGKGYNALKQLRMRMIAIMASRPRFGIADLARAQLAPEQAQARTLVEIWRHQDWVAPDTTSEVEEYGLTTLGQEAMRAALELSEGDRIAALGMPSTNVPRDERAIAGKMAQMRIEAKAARAAE